jgi:hypothetical protein
VVDVFDDEDFDRRFRIAHRQTQLGFEHRLERDDQVAGLGLALTVMS